MKAAVAILLSALLAGCQTTGGNSAKVGDILYTSAATAEQNADYVAAAQHYAKIHAEDPDDITVLFALARNLRYSGSSAQSVAVLQGAAETAGDEPGYRLALGKAHLAAGKTRPAIDVLEKAAQARADNWEIHATLGISYDLIENFSKAQGAYGRALRLSPDNPAVINNMAISKALSGNLDAAIATLRNAPRIARHNPQIRQNLALFYGIKGDMESAKSLSKVDLDDDTVRQNLEIYSQLRGK